MTLTDLLFLSFLFCFSYVLIKAINWYTSKKRELYYYDETVRMINNYIQSEMIKTHIFYDEYKKHHDFLHTLDLRYDSNTIIDAKKFLEYCDELLENKYDVEIAYSV